MKIAFLLLIAVNALAQVESKVGKLAPNLTFNSVINAKSAYFGAAELKGKVIVLDFWATWCAPCVASLPHLEKLQDRFKEDLQVITISDESKLKIERFIDRRKLSLPVALDSAHAIAALFPHRLIPHTVVIGKDGVIKAITTADKLSEDILNTFVREESVTLKEKRDVLDFNQFVPLAGNKGFLYQLTITPFQDGLPSMANTTGANSEFKNRRILAVNLAPAALYEIAYQFPIGFKTIDSVRHRDNFDWNEKNALCYDLIVPKQLAAQRFAIMQQNLATLFPYRVQLEKRTRAVKVLKRLNQSRLTRVDPNGEADIQYLPNKFVFSNVAMHDLSRFFEDELHIPIVDETGVTAPFDLTLAYSTGDMTALEQELLKNGFQLVDAQRSIDILVIYDR